MTEEVEKKIDPENTLILETSKGNVVIELLPDIAPEHVKRIKELVRAGAYNKVIFHRVIDGFMAQTGDVEFGKKGSRKFKLSHVGMGGSKKPDLKAEFSNIPHKRGTVSMARSRNPNSGNSQFFICFEDAPWLNRQYTVWGQVVEGMENVDQLKRGEPARGADLIQKATIASDVE